MSRNTKIVIIIIIILTVAAVILAFLNRENIAEKKAMQDSGAFIILSNGDKNIVAMDDIVSLNPRIIDANYKPSGNNTPVKKQYTGISLKSLFDYYDINYSSAKSVSFIAADGYASALPIADALDENNCFIVFEEEGELLGTKENGGKGPFMMILANDQFSQRWCKFLMEVKIKGD